MKIVNYMKSPILACAVLLMTVLSASAQNVKVTYYSPEIVRIEKSADGTGRAKKSVCVIAEPAGKVSKPKVKVSVADDGTVTFSDRKGRILLVEDSCSLTPIAEGVDKGAFVAGQGWRLDPDEPVYGLGMLQNGKMNLRGENRTMIQNNLEDYANFFQSVKGYGIFWDNYSPTGISDDGTVLSFKSQVAEEIDYYFIYGGDADGVIAGLRKLTGAVPMQALWTYGYNQSRERYVSQEEIVGVVKRYRDLGVPIDGIIQDWQYWGESFAQWNSMEFLNHEFPDPKSMVQQIHNLNAHMLISVWPSFGPKTDIFRQFSEKGMLLDFDTFPNAGDGVGVRCYDAYNAQARDIFWDKLSIFHDLGIDGWGLDATEPEELPQGVGFDLVTGMGSWRSVRNIYPLMCVEGVYDHQRKASEDKRVFILTRSYFIGQQRTGAHAWSGDISSNWGSFRSQIPLCLNYTLTGNPFVNTDLGGFFAVSYNNGPEPACSGNPLFQELYVRWLQFGCFTPLMRSHGTNSRREIWQFGKKGEPIYDAIEKGIRLRYALLPYTYSTSWQVSRNNDSFMRALVMDFRSDRKTWDLDDEFMYGRSFLVAPVTHALYTGDERPHWSEDVPDWTEKKSMDVYLPEGSRWYDFYTDKVYEGGVDVNVDASLDHCPLFVREGSVVPIGPDVQYSSEKSWDNLEIRVYAGKEGSFTLYEDEGDNYNYEKGAFSSVEFTLKGRKLKIGARHGSYPGMIESRVFNIRYVDGEHVVTRTVNYKGRALKVRL